MNLLVIAVIVVILLALGFVAMGALNLYAAEPRARGIQLGLFALALVVVGIVYAEVGIGLAAALFVAVVLAQLLFVLRKRTT
jgi:hypothetical protein